MSTAARTPVLAPATAVRLLARHGSDRPAPYVHRAVLFLQQARPTQRACQAHVAHRQNRKRKQYGDRRAGDAVDGHEHRVEIKRSDVFDV